MSARMAGSGAEYGKGNTADHWQGQEGDTPPIGEYGTVSENQSLLCGPMTGFTAKGEKISV